MKQIQMLVMSMALFLLAPLPTAYAQQAMPHNQSVDLPEAVIDEERNEYLNSVIAVFKDGMAENRVSFLVDSIKTELKKKHGHAEVTTMPTKGLPTEYGFLWQIERNPQRLSDYRRSRDLFIEQLESLPEVEYARPEILVEPANRR
jgi:hypothetical protein